MARQSQRQFRWRGLLLSRKAAVADEHAYVVDAHRRNGRSLRRARNLVDLGQHALAA
jgi:hypothetical protein